VKPSSEQRTVIPPLHQWLRYSLRTAIDRDKWWVLDQRGCRIRLDGPYPTEEAARAAI
jgi:hypothetical protein